MGLTPNSGRLGLAVFIDSWAAKVLGRSLGSWSDVYYFPEQTPGFFCDSLLGTKSCGALRKALVRMTGYLIQ